MGSQRVRHDWVTKQQQSKNTRNAQACSLFSSSSLSLRKRKALSHVWLCDRIKKTHFSFSPLHCKIKKKKTHSPFFSFSLQHHLVGALCSPCKECPFLPASSPRFLLLVPWICCFYPEHFPDTCVLPLGCVSAAEATWPCVGPECLSGRRTVSNTSVAEVPSMGLHRMISTNTARKLTNKRDLGKLGHLTWFPGEPLSGLQAVTCHSYF